MAFLDDNFMLKTTVAQRLYHEYAADQPIVDYHCHLSPKEIYDNQQPANLTRLWLSEGTVGDHYKWRIMRANGVPERLITGDGDDYDKFVAWAGTLERAIGNPLFEWSHLELRRYFGIHEVLNRQSAPQIWARANELLADPAFTPRELIKRSNVAVVVTTDDPADDLYYHQLLADEEDAFRVLPGMRPDVAMAIEQLDFALYMEKLAAVSGIAIDSFASLVTALDQRFEAFHALGGRISDYGLNTYHYAAATPAEIEDIFAKGLANEPLTELEIAQYTTAFLQVAMRQNKAHGWAMQYHINAVRAANKPQFDELGPNVGGDSVGTQADMPYQMRLLFEEAQRQGILPKSVVYSLNDKDWLELVTLLGSFQEGPTQKMQFGAAWWFNDTHDGMVKQLKLLASQGLLANFVGMLTDSRSFLSYPRHEYFRRILCDVIGDWVANGQVPDDMAYLGQIVTEIAGQNAHDYFDI